VELIGSCVWVLGGSGVGGGTEGSPPDAGNRPPSYAPGQIEELIDVDRPHPRDLGAPEYGPVRNRLYERLGVSHRI